MAEDLAARIAALEDDQAVDLLNFFGRRLVQGMSVDKARIEAGIPVEVGQDPTFSHMRALTIEQRKQRVRDDVSPALAREILSAFARTERFRPALAAAFAEHSGTLSGVETVLAIGFAASMVLIVASTSFEGEILGIHIRKGETTAAQIRAVTEPLCKILPSILGKS